MTRVPEWTAAYQRVLGDELRQARRMRGWTRRDLQRRLGLDISLQTLATYELGTRSITHVRLVLIAMALEVDLPALEARVRDRVFADTERASSWDVDLTAASELDDPQLSPVRRWARCRLRDTPPVPTIVRVGLAAMGNLAALCDMEILELARRLPRPREVQPLGRTA